MLLVRNVIFKYWYVTLFCLIAFGQAQAQTKLKQSQSLSQYFSFDKFVSSIEKKQADALLELRRSSGKERIEGLVEKSKKLSDLLSGLYKKRLVLVEDMAKKTTADDLATLNEVTLTLFYHEVRKRRPFGYPEQLWTKAIHRSDKRCPDILTDKVLADLVEGLVTTNSAQYAQSLSRVVQGLECYSMAESLSFARDLVRAYHSAVNYFSDNKELVAKSRSYLNYSLANLFIVVHDLTKSYGPTELYQFLRDHRNDLAEVFRNQNSPIHIAGYWIYDLRLDRMVSIGPLCESMSSNRPLNHKDCISATATLDALTDPARLAMGSCLLVDMLSASFDIETGYLCQRDVCSDNTVESQLLGNIIEDGETPFGHPISDLRKQNNCDNGQGGVAGGSGGLLGLLGDSRDYMRCVTETLLAERKGDRACFVSVAQQNRASRFGFSPPQNDHDNCSDPLTDGRKNRQLKKIRDKIGTILDEVFEENSNLEDVSLLIRDATIITDVDEVCSDICQLTQDGGDHYDLIWNSRFVKSSNREMLKEKLSEEVDEIAGELEERHQGDIVHALAVAGEAIQNATNEGEDAAVEEDNFFCWAWEDNCPPSTPENDGGEEYCHPDAGDCNHCSALSSAQNAMLDCFSTNDSAVPTRPGIPEQIEPLPWDDPDAPAWAECLQEDDSNNEALACGNLECNDNELPGLNESGQCVCKMQATLIGNAQPEPIDCPQGTNPVVGPGGVPLCSAPGMFELTGAN